MVGWSKAAIFQCFPLLSSEALEIGRKLSYKHAHLILSRHMALYKRVLIDLLIELSDRNIQHGL